MIEDFYKNYSFHGDLNYCIIYVNTLINPYEFGGKYVEKNYIHIILFYHYICYTMGVFYV